MPGQEMVRSCDWEVKSRCASGSASVTFVGGVPAKVSVDSYYCGPRRGAPGYSCTVMYERSDKHSVWSEHGNTLVISNQESSPSQPDKLKLVIGKHISIDLDETPRVGNCGAGAELPRAIVIPEGEKVCRVWLFGP